MKIIDLLNKIANGEEVPKKIKVFGDEFEFLYQSGNRTYFNYDGDYLFSDEYDWENNLNNEVEIIEEKEIEKGIKPYKQYVEELGKDGYGLSEINEEYLDRLSKIVIELINDMRDKE